MEPVQGMIDQVLSYLPNVLWAAAILLVGWFVARVIRQVVVSFLAAIGADRLGERIGLSAALGKQTLSGLVGLVVYVLIMLVVLISALDALAIAAISGPAIAMLEQILGAVPGIVGALVVLVIAYFVAKLVGDLVASLLSGIGFDRLLVWLKLGDEPKEGQRTPSEIVGTIVLVIIMLLAVTGAAELLGFGSMTSYVSLWPWWSLPSACTWPTWRARPSGRWAAPGAICWAPSPGWPSSFSAAPWPWARRGSANRS
jgi:hypothetical protein